MKPIILVPLIALALAGSSAGGYFWLSSEGSVEEAVIAQATPTPTPAATGQETPSTLAAPAEESQLAPPPAQTPAVPDDSLIYHDAEFGFSVDHPVDWAVAPVAIDADLAGLDVLKGIEFVGKGGLPRARVFTFQNPKDLTLEDWIMDHDVIFFDRPPVEITIDGVRALLAPLNFAGQPSPLAYVKKGSLVFGLSGLTNDDYEELVAGIRFDGQ